MLLLSESGNRPRILFASLPPECHDLDPHRQGGQLALSSDYRSTSSVPPFQHSTRPGGMIMLVLSRKQGERLVIDDNIVVTVLRVAGGTVRIGIEAPLDKSIFRSEIRNRAKDDSKTNGIPRLGEEKAESPNQQWPLTG